jgi:hypothetical protein
MTISAPSSSPAEATTSAMDSLTSGGDHLCAGQPPQWWRPPQHARHGEEVLASAGANPSAKRRRIPSKQVVYHFEHSLSLGALGMKSQGHGKLWQREAKTLKAKGHRELGGERTPRVGKKQDMAATRGVNPFLKADFPARAPKRHEQGLPRCAPGFPSYDMGAWPHMSYKLA